MAVSLRAATPDDLRSYIGSDPHPAWSVESFGILAERDGAIIALGIVTWDRYGRAWGWFSRREAVSAIAVHRLIIEAFGHLRKLGEPALYVLCDTSIPTAERWLRLLGFRRIPELIVDGEHPVWVCDLT
jgi:hypothetical protein